MVLGIPAGMWGNDEVNAGGITLAAADVCWGTEADTFAAGVETAAWVGTAAATGAAGVATGVIIEGTSTTAAGAAVVAAGAETLT